MTKPSSKKSLLCTAVLAVAAFTLVVACGGSATPASGTPESGSSLVQSTSAKVSGGPAGPGTAAGVTCPSSAVLNTALGASSYSLGPNDSESGELVCTYSPDGLYITIKSGIAENTWIEGLETGDGMNPIPGQSSIYANGYAVGTYTNGMGYAINSPSGRETQAQLLTLLSAITR
jgi:hypothetical protein